MAASARRDLFISVNGSIDNLSNALKAGRTALLDFNSATGSIVEEVERKFKEMGSGAGSGAEELARNYTNAAKRIQSSMQEALRSGNAGDALKIFDINAINSEIAKAEQLAAANRKIAEAAEIAAKQGGQYAQVQLAIAAASAQAAVKGEAEVVALRQQAGALGEVTAALTNTVGAQQQSSGQFVNSARAQRFAMVNLGQQFTDFTVQATTGAGVVRAFAQQMPQATFALSGFGGRLGTVGAFLNGPWGIGLQIAVLTLAPFISSLLESGSALDAEIDKLKKDAAQTDLARRAKEFFATTEAGVTKAINDQKEALDKSVNASKSAAAQANIEAQANLNKEISIRKTTKALLEQAQAEYEIIKIRSQAPGQRGENASLGLEGAGAAVAGLQARLTQNDQDLATAISNLDRTRTTLATEQGKRSADPRNQISDRFDAQISDAQKKANAAIAAARGLGKNTNDITDALYASVAVIEKRRDAALKAYDASLSKGNNRENGREVTPAEAAGIARAAGLQVNSTSRTFGEQKRLYDAWVAAGKPADNPVAMPGTSAHEGANGRWALDIQFGPGVTPELLRKVFADQGITLSKVFKERGHFHVEGSRSQSDSAASAVEDAAQKEAERIAAFNQQLTQAQGEYLQAQTALTADADEQLSVGLARIEAERVNRDAAVDRAVIAKKLTTTEAGELKAIYDRTADAKSSVATNRAITKTLDETLRVTRDELRDKLTILDLQGDLATTAKMRKRIALQILDLEEQERRAVANRLLASHDPKDQAEGQRQLDQIDREAPLRRAQIDKRNTGPLDDYRNKLHAATDDMDEALQGVAAHGLQNLEDGLLGIIDGTESVGSAFKKMAASIIADLARIAIEKAIVAGIELITGASGGHIGGTGGTAVHPFATGMIPGFAGGTITGPGSGTSDSILAFYGKQPIRVSNGESIMTAAATRRFGAVLKAMNDNRIPGFAGGGVPSWPSLPAADQMRSQANAPIVIHLATRKGEAFETEVLSVSGPHTVEILRAAAPGMIDMASDTTISRLNRPALSGQFG